MKYQFAKGHFFVRFEKAITVIVFVASLLFSAVTLATSPGLTYHGRLLSASGTPITSSAVQFQVQILSAGGTCLLWQEAQTLDLSATSGVFVLGINDGSGTRNDGGAYNFQQIFSNSQTLNCSGGGTYTPTATDGRSMIVYFNDGTFTGWEAAPSQAINYTPKAIDALQVAGYPATSLLRLSDTTVVTTPLTTPQYNQLVALINGNSANGTDIPVVAGAPSSPVQGQMWFNSVTNKVQYYDGTTTQTIGAGSVTGITATLPLSTTGGTTPTLSLAGLSALGSANQILGMNNAGTAYEYKTVTGTTNQITVTNSANSITLATPQNIHTGATPTFANVNLSGLGVNRILMAGSLTTSPLTYDACSVNQILQFGGATWGCTTLSTALATTAFLQGGNTFGATANLGTLDANSLNFVTGASGPNPRMTITSAGNVGIGTTSPVMALHVGGSSITSGTLYFGANSTTAGSNVSSLSSTALTFNVNSGLNGPFTIGAGAVTNTSSGGNLTVLAQNGWGTGAYNGGDLILESGAKGSLGSNGAIRFQVGATEAMRVDQSGNVGIGTTSPTSSLHVNSPSGTNAVETISTSGSAYAVLQLSTDSRAWQFGTGGSTSAWPGIWYIYNSGTANSAFAIDGSNNVGIGGSINGGSGVLTGEKVYINGTSGNVGIGTTSPTSLLTMSSTTSDILGLTGTNGSATRSIAVNTSGQALSTTVGARISFIDDSNYGAHVAIATGTGNGNTTPAERLRVTSGGNVGIGATSPTASLQIKAGTAAAGTSPLKFTSGTLMTTPEAGAMEYDGANLYFTNNTPTRIALATTTGGQTISGNETFSGDMSITGSGTGLSVTNAATIGGVTSITNSTASTSTSTGALVVSGGIGAAGNIYSGGVLAASSGTYALPSHTFTGDTASGMWSPATGALAFSANALERMRITSSGNVGIGTTSPSVALDVNGTIKTEAGGNLLFGTTLPTRQTNSAAYPGIFVGNSNSSVMGETTSGYRGLILAANVVRDTSLAWVSQDTTQPGWMAAMDYETANTDAFNILRAPASSGALGLTSLFYIKGSSGNVGIGTTSPGSILDITGPSGSVANNETSTTNSFQIETGKSAGDQILWMGNDKTNHLSYIQSTDYLTTNAALQLNPRGGSVVIAGGGTTISNGTVSTTTVSAGSFALTDHSSETFTGSYGTHINGDTTHPVQVPNAALLVGYTASGATYSSGTLLVSGNVGIGTTSPGSGTSLRVNGQIAPVSSSQAGPSIDWSLGNAATTSYDCASGSLSFMNLRDGGAYTLVVTSTSTAQCSFSTTTTGDDAATVSYRFLPANTTRIASSHTLYSLQRIGTTIYVSWLTGF